MNPSDATNKNATRDPRLHLAAPRRLGEHRGRDVDAAGGIDAVDEEIVRLLDRRAWLARG
jgi:hypothetical protein